MNVLSLFDGMSCGQQAFERVGIKVDNYYASEIDKYAITVTMANYPNTIQLGSVIDVNGYNLPKIDFLIGGSPCQSFSFAGKRKGMSTKDEQEILTLEHYLELKAEGYEFEGQSYLFWEFMRLLNETKPKYFLLENVMMSKKWELVLTKAIGVECIMINSSLVSAQNRKRLYWTNIGLESNGLFADLKSIIKQPEDKEILLKDILETNVDQKYFLNNEKINTIKQTNVVEIKSEILTPKRTEYGKSIRKEYEAGNINLQRKEIQTLQPRTDGKTNTLTTVQKDNLLRKVYQLSQNNKSNGGTQPYQQDRIYDINGISPALQAQLPGGSTMVYLNENQQKKFNENVNADKSNTLTLAQGRAGSSSEYMDSVSKIAKLTSRIRRLTPIECERLQTVKDNYTNHVSDSQRYKMLGNGWTVDVIAHILSYANIKD